MNNNKLIFVLLWVLSLSSFSQNATTDSPYSRYGIGILRPEGFSQSFGLGGTGIGLRSNRDISLLNPASFSKITVTTFDIGFNHSALWLNDGTESQYQNNPYIHHIAFAFPMIRNTWGLSFGVLPHSSIGYNYDEDSNDAVAGSVSTYSFGSGAINRAYLGNAIRFKIDSTSEISVGANANFYFGSNYRDTRVIFGELPNGFNIWNARETVVSDFGFDLGLQYQKEWTTDDEGKLKFAFGATYKIASDLSTKNSETIMTFGGVDQFIRTDELKDTTSFSEDVVGTLQLPATFGIGFSLEKQNKWLIAIDYTSTNWSAISSNDPIFDYRSNSSLSGGIQFIPKYDDNNYLKRIAYRIGSRYNTSYIAINDIDWTEYGITFGIGLPIRKAENSFPRLNLGIEYGNRGTLDGGLVKEEFVNFNLGITINAVWFQKRKYD